MRFTRFASNTLALCLVVSFAGCASVAVTDNAIEHNTALALGLDKDQFTVADRSDDGIKTTYAVKTKSGKRYSCYVTGTLSVIGRTVSDAMCTELGRAGKPSGSSSSGGGSCNALLKAAGRC